MNVLLVGGGGREHALAWALSKSPALTALHAAPGNPGIASHATCHPVAADDAEGLLGLAGSLRIQLVVVGPEGPLVAGVADVLRHAGIPVFGPSAAAAAIEGSKHFAKDVMEAAGVPTARRLPQAKAPCVLKVDGLAAGKGVVVCHTAAEVRAGLELVESFGGAIVIEELLVGPEVSLFALCDGRRAFTLGTAQDFKRAFDGDSGPNTGGMGSYAPVAWLDSPKVEQLLELTVLPVLAELEQRGAPFRGVLFVGLMLTENGPRVLEYNCRFGDPETQSVLPLVDGDLLVALAAAAAGDVSDVTLGQRAAAAVTVVLTAAEYPAGEDRGTPIVGLEQAEAAGVLVFHAGTARRDGTLVTNGGRILDVTAVGATLEQARLAAYDAVELVGWSGARRRNDIALRAASGGVSWPPAIG